MLKLQTGFFHIISWCSKPDSQICVTAFQLWVMCGQISLCACHCLVMLTIRDLIPLQQNGQELVPAWDRRTLSSISRLLCSFVIFSLPCPSVNWHEGTAAIAASSDPKQCHRPPSTMSACALPPHTAVHQAKRQPPTSGVSYFTEATSDSYSAAAAQGANTLSAAGGRKAWVGFCPHTRPRLVLRGVPTSSKGDENFHFGGGVGGSEGDARRSFLCTSQL